MIIYYYLFCLTCQIFEIQSRHLLLLPMLVLIQSVHSDTQPDPMMQFVLLFWVVSLYWRQRQHRYLHTPSTYTHSSHTLSHITLTNHSPSTCFQKCMWSSNLALARYDRKLILIESGWSKIHYTAVDCTN